MRRPFKIRAWVEDEREKANKFKNDKTTTTFRFHGTSIGFFQVPVREISPKKPVNK